MYNIKEKKIWGGFMYVVLGFVCVFLHNFDIVVCVSVTMWFLFYLPDDMSSLINPQGG